MSRAGALAAPSEVRRRPLVAWLARMAAGVARGSSPGAASREPWGRSGLADLEPALLAGALARAWRQSLAAIASALDRHQGPPSCDGAGAPEAEPVVRDFDGSYLLPYAARLGLSPERLVELRRAAAEGCRRLLAAADALGEQAVSDGDPASPGAEPFPGGTFLPESLAAWSTDVGHWFPGDEALAAQACNLLAHADALAIVFAFFVHRQLEEREVAQSLFGKPPALLFRSFSPEPRQSTPLLKLLSRSYPAAKGLWPSGMDSLVVAVNDQAGVNQKPRSWWSRRPPGIPDPEWAFDGSLLAPLKVHSGAKARSDLRLVSAVSRLERVLRILGELQNASVALGPLPTGLARGSPYLSPLLRDLGLTPMSTMAAVDELAQLPDLVLDPDLSALRSLEARLGHDAVLYRFASSDRLAQYRRRIVTDPLYVVVGSRPALEHLDSMQSFVATRYLERFLEPTTLEAALGEDALVILALLRHEEDAIELGERLVEKGFESPWLHHNLALLHLWRADQEWGK